MDEIFEIFTFSPEGNPNSCIYLKKNGIYVDSTEILEQFKRFLTDYFGNRYYYSGVRTDKAGKLMFWLNVNRGKSPPTKEELKKALSVFYTKSTDPSLEEEKPPTKQFTKARKEEEDKNRLEIYSDCEAMIPLSKEELDIIVDSLKKCGHDEVTQKVLDEMDRFEFIDEESPEEEFGFYVEEDEAEACKEDLLKGMGGSSVSKNTNEIVIFDKFSEEHILQEMAELKTLLRYPQLEIEDLKGMTKDFQKRKNPSATPLLPHIFQLCYLVEEAISLRLNKLEKKKEKEAEYWKKIQQEDQRRKRHLDQIKELKRDASYYY